MVNVPIDTLRGLTIILQKFQGGLVNGHLAVTSPEDALVDDARRIHNILLSDISIGLDKIEEALLATLKASVQNMVGEEEVTLDNFVVVPSQPIEA